MSKIGLRGLLLITATLGACNQAPNNAVAAVNGASPTNQADAAAPHANVAQATPPKEPLSPAPAASLADYVGKYPPDPVNGVAFYDQPRVRAAVRAAVPDGEVRSWIFERAGPQTPIERHDGRLLSWGCEAHNCGPHQWAVLIDEAGTVAEVCYHEDSMGEQARWYVAGRAPEMRQGECPSE
ncbi:MAG TPA: hypothetical protein VIT38_17175 [Allosphingosinicella sp.]